MIEKCMDGTFNVCLPTPWEPPGHAASLEYGRLKGNDNCAHICDTAWVVGINGVALEAWFYFGGFPLNKWELVSIVPIVWKLGLQENQEVNLLIEAVADQGTK